MSDNLQIAMDRLLPVFKATDEVLNEWSGEKCMQFPNLLGMIAIKLNWDEKQIKENDPFVRWYVRSHADWHVTRGAHGGIMKAENKQKKDSDRIAKILAKAEIKAAIESSAALKSAASTPVIDNKDSSDSMFDESSFDDIQDELDS